MKEIVIETVYVDEKLDYVDVFRDENRVVGQWQDDWGILVEGEKIFTGFISSVKEKKKTEELRKFMFLNLNRDLDWKIVIYRKKDKIALLGFEMAK